MTGVECQIVLPWNIVSVSSLQGCVLTTGVCPHYRGVSSLQGCVLTTGVCPHYRGVFLLQGCVLTTGVCPHYRGVSSLQGCVLTTGVCSYYRGVSSLQGCVLTTGVCSYYRGVSSLQGCVLTTGVCVLTTGMYPHFRGCPHYRGCLHHRPAVHNVYCLLFTSSHSSLPHPYRPLAGMLLLHRQRRLTRYRTATLLNTHLQRQLRSPSGSNVRMSCCVGVLLME